MCRNTEWIKGRNVSIVSRRLKTRIALSTELCLYKLIIVIFDHIKDWLEVETFITIPYSFVLFALNLLFFKRTFICTITWICRHV